MSSSPSDCTSDIQEFLQIGTRCKERLELHVKSLSEARSEDRKHIHKLERELLNCYQEIDYLQDQLNARNVEVYSLGERVHELELKLSDMDYLYVKIGQLQEELRKSDSELFFLTKELESKEAELLKSILSIEKLEQSISSLTLDSQCEIESMKLDITALEQACCEAKNNQQETILEKRRLDGSIEELEIRLHDAERIIKCFEKENKELREKFVASEVNGRHFLQKIHEWMESKDEPHLNPKPFSSDLDSGIMPEKASNCGEVLGELFSKLSILLEPESTFRKKFERMSDQISEYEVLLKQLKQELRMEKLKAKEEAEDLTQEMAELRYQMTGLLEEECKRRACIEQASLQRIAELEAQIQKEQRTHRSAVKDAHEV